MVLRKNVKWRMTILVKLLVAPFLLVGCSGVEVLNALAPQQGVEKVENVTFQNEHNLQLDIYRPSAKRFKSQSDLPVIVFYWGGRWQEGDKAMYDFLGRELATRGFITVIPNYRLWPDVGFKGFLTDSADAFDWVDKQIAGYGGDRESIFLMGHSAGAYNAVMLALNTPFSRGINQKLAGAIGISGPYDFLPFSADEGDLKQIFAPAAEYPLTQPINWADGKNAPLLLIHSEDDQIVYAKNAINLYCAVEAQGGEAELKLVASQSHPMMIGVVSNILSWRAPVADWVEHFVGKHSRD